MELPFLQDRLELIYRKNRQTFPFTEFRILLISIEKWASYKGHVKWRWANGSFTIRFVVFFSIPSYGKRVIENIKDQSFGTVVAYPKELANRKQKLYDGCVQFFKTYGIDAADD